MQTRLSQSEWVVHFGLRRRAELANTPCSGCAKTTFLVPSASFHVCHSRNLCLVFTLITGTDPPRVIREPFLPPLDIDMPIRVPFGRGPIQTQEKSPISTLSAKDSYPPASPGANDDTVIPSDDDVCARTLVLCFDGTGDQFCADVRPKYSHRLFMCCLLTQCHSEFQCREIILYAEEGR